MNLLIHNHLFPATSYDLLGFCKYENMLHAVVKQRYISITEATDLDSVEKIMNENGFVRIRNNDYRHPEAGLIIEDLHDENVLTRNGTLFFIDTVIYYQHPMNS